MLLTTWQKPCKCGLSMWGASPPAGNDDASVLVYVKKSESSSRIQAVRQAVGHSFLAMRKPLCLKDWEWCCGVGIDGLGQQMGWGRAKKSDFLYNSSSSVFVMLNATSMGGSVAEFWVMDRGSVVKKHSTGRHRQEQGRGGAGSKEASTWLKAPKRLPSEVKMSRKKTERTKPKIKAELFSSASKWLTLKLKLLLWCGKRLLFRRGRWTQMERGMTRAKRGAGWREEGASGGNVVMAVQWAAGSGNPFHPPHVLICSSSYASHL